MNIGQFNKATSDDARAVMLQCCTATNWVERMIAMRPYLSSAALVERAGEVWAEMSEGDFLEAFDGHPKIGDPDSLKKKYRATHAVASDEQSGAAVASDDTLTALAEANVNYLEKYGFIFIICATGKSAAEMLDNVRGRLDNTRVEELSIAAAEQLKITTLRLNKQFDAGITEQLNS